MRVAESQLVASLPAAPPPASWHAATQRRVAIVVAVAAVLASLLGAGLVISLQLVSLAVIGAWIALIAIASQPRLGLLVVVALVLLLEAGGPDPLMSPGAYLYGGFSSTLGLSEAIVSPLEILLGLTFLSWFAQGIARRRLRWRGGALAKPVVVFALALLLGLARGAIDNGDLNVALWELRYLAGMLIAYCLAANTLRTRAHLATLVALILFAVGAFAIEGAYRRFALINTGLLGVSQELQFAHEDVIFLAVGVILVVLQQSFGAPRWLRALGLALAPAMVFTMLATQRRAGFVALALAIAVLVVVLFASRPRLSLMLVPALAAGAAGYLALFWGEPGLLGQPARAIRSLFEPDARDAASNFYRYLEAFNIRATIAQDPLFGVGFGRPFLFAVGLPDLSWWPFWHFEPHNSVLWVWLKTGVFGFIAFLALCGTAIGRGVDLARRRGARDVRLLAALAVSATVMVLVYSYVDLGLVSVRVMVFFGAVLGAFSVADRTEEPS